MCIKICQLRGGEINIMLGCWREWWLGEGVLVASDPANHFHSDNTPTSEPLDLKDNDDYTYIMMKCECLSVMEKNHSLKSHQVQIWDVFWEVLNTFWRDR